MPHIESPFRKPAVWTNGADCFFMDSDEATQEQLRFVSRVKRICDARSADPAPGWPVRRTCMSSASASPVVPYETELAIPRKFKHVDLEQVARADSRAAELAAVLKKNPSLVVAAPWALGVGHRQAVGCRMGPQIFPGPRDPDPFPHDPGQPRHHEPECDDSGGGQSPVGGQARVATGRAQFFESAIGSFIAGTIMTWGYLTGTSAKL